jgi:hypothetical protein
VVKVETETGLPDQRPEHPGERELERLDDGHVSSQLAGGRSDLHTDETSADHEKARAGRSQDGSEGHGVVDRAQQVDAGLSLETRQGSRAGTGRDNQPVEAEVLARRKGHRACLGIETRRTIVWALPAIQRERLELVVLAEPDLVERPLTGKELLRQRWAIVRQVALVAEQDYLSCVVAGPKSLTCTKARQTCADDHYPLHQPYAFRLRSSPYLFSLL